MYGRRSVFAAKRRRPWGRYLAAVLVGLLLLCGVYTALDNGRVSIQTQRVFVGNLPGALEGFTILHVSDLGGKRFGPDQKHVASALKNRRYSAVCMTGDMVGPTGDVQPLLELLAALDPTKPVYFVAGDADPVAVGGPHTTEYSVLADWVLSVQQNRGSVFLGAPASQQVGGATVWFTDASQLSLDLATAANAYASSNSALSAYYAGVVADTQTARNQMKEDDLHIALSHKPLGQEMVRRLQGITDAEGISFVRTVDLVLAGSTVGGQWRVPFVGGVWSDGSWFPQDNHVKGYWSLSASLPQYISAGLGTDVMNPLPAFRLFNRPEMTLITFTSDMDDDSLPMV